MLCMQGVGFGALVAANGVSRGVNPYLCRLMFTCCRGVYLNSLYCHTVDVTYELEGKRTFLLMLIQVAIYTPLLVGLILLYPWLAGSRRVMKQDNQSKDIENKEKTEPNGLSDN